MLKKPTSLLLLLGLILAELSTVVMPSAVSALSISDWKPGLIIADTLFYNKNDMSVADIQAFLNALVPTCDTWGTKMYNATQTRAQYGASIGTPAPFICLRDYYENPTTHETNFNPTATIPSGAKSAAQIIYDAANSYNISPRALLVTLKKEAPLNLIADDWPMLWEYRSSMGYGCPDTAPCDQQYYGFYNQMMNAARQFRLYAQYPESYRYRAGQSVFVQYNPDTRCGSSSVYIESNATAGLYNYTPYQPNQATLSWKLGNGGAVSSAYPGCGAFGNINFWKVWNEWFGPTTGPAAFTVAGSGQIYVPLGQYKFAVPYAAVMQDFGISWEAVQNVSQQYVDSIPSAPSSTGLSTSIGHVIKSPSDTDSDGGSLYLIARGKRYQFQTMQQLSDFGFTEANIAYLPLINIISISNGGMLPNFVTSPYGSVFQITNGKKRVIFEYTTYSRLNPADTIAPLSYYLVDKIPSGDPLADRPIMVKNKSSEVVNLFTGGTTYNQIPTYDAFVCWGLNAKTQIPIYRVPQDDYLAPVVNSGDIGCNYSTVGGEVYLSNGAKIMLPSCITLNSPQLPQSLSGILAQLPQRTNALSTYVKAPNAAVVWSLDKNIRRSIPTYNTFLQMGLTAQAIDVIDSNTLGKFSYGGIKLNNGQLVKTTDSSSVFVVNGNARYSYQTSDSFLAYRNSWPGIDTISKDLLDASYPVNGSVSSLLVDKQNNKAYLVGTNFCSDITSSVVTTLGKTVDELMLEQAYGAEAFTSLKTLTCVSATRYVRPSNQSLVYRLENGTKRPILTYGALLSSNGGAEPKVIALDPLYVSSIPVGAAL